MQHLPHAPHVDHDLDVVARRGSPGYPAPGLRSRSRPFSWRVPRPSRLRALQPPQGRRVPPVRGPREAGRLPPAWKRGHNRRLRAGARRGGGMHPAAGVPAGIQALGARRRAGRCVWGVRSRGLPCPDTPPRLPGAAILPFRLSLLQGGVPPSWASGRVLGRRARGSPRAPPARDGSRRCRTHTARRGVRRELGLALPKPFLNTIEFQPDVKELFSFALFW